MANIPGVRVVHYKVPKVKVQPPVPIAPSPVQVAQAKVVAAYKGQVVKGFGGKGPLTDGS